MTKPSTVKRAPGRKSLISPPPSTTPPSTTPPSTAPSPLAAAPLPIVIGTAVGLAALGFVVGVGGSFLQARTVTLGLRWPLGCVSVLVVLGAVALSAGLVTRSRLGVGMVAAGWVISVLLFTAGRPEGDVIIAADVPGYLYLFGGVTVLAVVSVVPFTALPPQSGASSSAPSSAPPA